MTFFLRSVPSRASMLLSILTLIMATLKLFQVHTKVTFPFLSCVHLPSCLSHAVEISYCHLLVVMDHNVVYMFAISHSAGVCFALAMH
jgi:hypothetical protein